LSLVGAGDAGPAADGAGSTSADARADGGGTTATPDASTTTEASAEAGTDGSATASDAGAPPDLASAPADTWTWVPFPGVRCGNGSESGIGLNPHAGATHVLLYLQGGGACYDATSCWGASPTASNMNGYAAADFAADPTTGAEIFQRATAGNPFKDATMVFFPYCTGDLHIGTNVATYQVNGTATPTYFHGAKNVDAIAAALASAYMGLSRVYLSGVSAGGFGSFLNQDAVAHAFGSVRVDVLDDSGPALSGTGIPADWGARLPAACTTCTDANSTFLYMRKTYASSRYAFMTFQTDTTLPAFFGVTDQAFATEIQGFVSSLTSDPNATSFVDTASGHVVLAETDSTAAPFILPWLTQFATDDPAWAAVQH
jgi:hypothetical protein